MNLEDRVLIAKKRCYLLEDIRFYRSAKKMRLRSTRSSTGWNIAYEASKVFERRASEWIEGLGGMAGEW